MLIPEPPVNNHSNHRKYNPTLPPSLFYQANDLHPAITKQAPYDLPHVCMCVHPCAPENNLQVQ